MGKENRANRSSSLARALKEAGFKVTPVTIIFDPKVEKEVSDYVMRIEEAHKKAANSKLHFGSPLILNFQPSNS